MNADLNILSEKINEGIEYIHNHGCHKLIANVQVPLITKVCMLACKDGIDIGVGSIFNESGSGEYRQ